MSKLIPWGTPLAKQGTVFEGRDQRTGRKQPRTYLEENLGGDVFFRVGRGCKHRQARQQCTIREWEAFLGYQVRPPNAKEAASTAEFQARCKKLDLPPGIYGEGMVAGLAAIPVRKPTKAEKLAIRIHERLLAHPTSEYKIPPLDVLIEVMTEAMKGQKP